MSATPRILVVEHEAQFGAWLRNHLEILYPESTPMAIAPAELAARSDWLAGQSFDVILFCAHLTESSAAREIDAAFTPLGELCARPEQSVVIVLAEGGNEAAAVQALRRGAFDYLPRRGLGAAALAAVLQAGLAEGAHRAAVAAEARAGRRPGGR